MRAGARSWCRRSCGLKTGTAAALHALAIAVRSRSAVAPGTAAPRCRGPDRDEAEDDVQSVAGPHYVAQQAVAVDAIAGGLEQQSDAGSRRQ